jgi:hypothetical protein
MEDAMASPVASTTTAPAPERTLPWWSLGVVFVALAVVYLVLQENGAALGNAAAVLHEFFHDGRHGLGVPCH